jgi:guanylate kinase
MTRLTVISGPTAVGKGTVVRYLLSQNPGISLSVSATTRDPRPGELDGKDYFFVSQARFDQMIEDHELLEWATVHGVNRYGTPRAPVLAALAQGRQVILEIDIQGARAVKASMPECNTVFIAPPSFGDLAIRLAARGTETDTEIARRLVTAETEMAASGEFDHLVINDEVAKCAAAVLDLMQE